MILLKSVLTGIIAAIVVPMVWVLIGISIALVRFAAIDRSGSGGLDAVSMSLTEPAFFIAPIAFCLGFYWQFKRSSRLRSRRP